jgi:hypothetical protein
MLRFPYFLDNQLTDGGKVVSPTHRPTFTSSVIQTNMFVDLYVFHNNNDNDDDDKDNNSSSNNNFGCDKW